MDSAKSLGYKKKLGIRFENKIKEQNKGVTNKIKVSGRLCRKVGIGKRIMMLCVITIKFNSLHLLQ